MKLADNIKRHRKLNILTVKEASKKLDIPIAAWYFYESGERSPTLEILKKIAKGLGVSVSDLDPELGDVPENKGSFEFSVDKQMLNDAYDDLSAPAKLELQRLLREVQLKDKLKDSQTG